ncbi:rab11 family-interacting protein 2-like [Scleropages formosus]|uniref:Rab11 family-interacting protein 2-like n=1 Tax=Scleropages formosus TaxID=113540 RepID=A0A0P7VAJ1_SCLFO|nr:rab11 family-interacting protein 2-like [Scleropages formosus]
MHVSWFRLESKPGKKRKDRGQIQVSIQFMRNNMTASMFDLSVKEKPRSPFSKLKDRMKGRKHDGLFPDTFSAIVPRSTLGDADSPFSTGVSAGDTQLNSKKKRPQLLGPQKLSAAQSMSDLIHSWPKNESRNVTEESGRTLSPHKRSQSEVPECKAEASQVHSDSFAGIIEALPHKYATLPRNHNPFEGDRSMTWDKVDKKEKKEKDAKQVCLASYNSMSFPEVVQELIKQKEMVKKKDAHIRELEDYIDDLLVRVMEETPSILRKPYEPKKKAGKFPK